MRKTSEDYTVPVAQMSRGRARGLRRRWKRPAATRPRWSTAPVELSAYGGGISYVGSQGFGGLSIKKTDTTYGIAAEEDVTIGLKQTRVDAQASSTWTSARSTASSSPPAGPTTPTPSSRATRSAHTFLSDGLGKAAWSSSSPTATAGRGAFGVQAPAAQLRRHRRRGLRAPRPRSPSRCLHPPAARQG